MLNTHQEPQNYPKYNKSGDYKLLFDNYYIGQTGRSFTTLYKEYVQEIETFKKGTHPQIKYKYAQHIILN